MNPTLIGITAPIGWSFIPLISYYLTGIDPILLTAIVLFGFFLIEFTRQLITNNLINPFKIAKGYYIIGVFGIAGFHLFYFTALQISPIIIVFLIMNLTGVLNIIYSKILHGLEIKIKHVLAISINFLAIIFITYSKGLESFEYRDLLGYLFAFIAANCWSIYSVKNKDYSNVPISNVIYNCLLSAIIALMLYLVKSPFAFPAISLNQLFLILLLVLYPIGYCFFTWNYGIRFGDIRIISIFSYLSPILGSIWLILAGIQLFNWAIVISLAMIITSACILKLMK